MNDFKELIGKSVTGFEQVSECEAYLNISDGSRVEILCNDYCDCCGWNDFEVAIPEGFDFSDNVITKVDYNETEDHYDAAGVVTLGIFTNDAKINVEGAYGSGSGWGYGQFVTIAIAGKEE